jgi:hypothetical protein
MREEFSKLLKDNQKKEKIFSSLHNIAWSKENKNRKVPIVIRLKNTTNESNVLL